MFFAPSGYKLTDARACQQTIAGIATALLQASQPTWKAYAKQVIANAQTLGAELVAHGYKLQTSGTDNHLVLWDLRPLGLTGSKLEKLCDLVGITINSTSSAASARARLLTPCQKTPSPATRPRRCPAASASARPRSRRAT